MADPVTPFNDPEVSPILDYVFAVLIGHVQVLCLSVPAVRRHWALLLRDCAEKHAQEHPLYALFSSILSMLSKAVSVPGVQVSPASKDDGIIFSYPQCRLVDKNTVGDSEHGSMSAYPDFGLIHLATEQSSDGDTKVERVRLLIKIKRLYAANNSKT